MRILTAIFRTGKKRSAIDSFATFGSAYAPSFKQPKSSRFLIPWPSPTAFSRKATAQRRMICKKGLTQNARPDSTGGTMKIEHLEYLVDFAETRSVSVTAGHFYISTQGMSRALHRGRLS